MRVHLRYLFPLTILLALLAAATYQPASSSEPAKSAADSITILISDDLRGWFEGCG